jgi:16S rRNA (guanine(1405)-N(7))-methyltransferase
MSHSVTPDQIFEEIISGPKYRNLMPAFIRRVCEQECAKGRSHKDTVKAVRGKLHQAGAAYQEKGIPYNLLKSGLEILNQSSSLDEWKTFGLSAMQHHASTSERLSILEHFFQESLAEIAPVHSILDLACGLNPLAFPFMPLAKDASYLAGDIYLDMMEFLNQVFQKTPLKGQAIPLDLAAEIPYQPVQVAFLLKTLPCMEQQVKDYGRRLLNELKAEHLLVSFPIYSLGGRSKGMSEHYDQYMKSITGEQGWHIRRYVFSAELAYLISK